jgi:predicted P-loop ATPase
VGRGRAVAAAARSSQTSASGSNARVAKVKVRRGAGTAMPTCSESCSTTSSPSSRVRKASMVSSARWYAQTIAAKVEAPSCLARARTRVASSSKVAE